MSYIELTTENFEEKVLQSKIPVAVDFWAEWCMPCRMFAPVFEEVSEELEGAVVFGKINVDNQPDLAQKYKIMTIPTVLLFKGGEPVDKSVGGMTKDQLVQFLK